MTIKVFSCKLVDKCLQCVTSISITPLVKRLTTDQEVMVSNTLFSPFFFFFFFVLFCFV